MTRISGQRGELLGRPYRNRSTWDNLPIRSVGYFCHTHLGFEASYLTAILSAATLGGIIAYVMAIRRSHPRSPFWFFIGQILFSLLCGVVAAGLMPPCSTSSAYLVGLTGSATCYGLFKAAPLIAKQGQKDKG